VKSINKLLPFRITRTPLVSVIIPCFQAEATLRRAVASLVDQKWCKDDLEIILSVDDGRDYAWVARLWPNITICKSFSRGTGPGPTRNRGILAASGQFLAFLDADDMWSGGYLDALMPIVSRHGLAFGVTEVRSSEKDQVLVLGERQNHLCLQDFGRWPGSFHPVMRRIDTPLFVDQPAQDVLHAMTVLAAYGKAAPLVDAARYLLYLSTESVTASHGFSHNIDLSYKQMIHSQHKRSALPPYQRHQIIKALTLRRRWNRRFLAEGAKQKEQMSFYHFLARTLAHKK
jgi:glycosyltransferase involved in cell wall biosynthesis